MEDHWRHKANQKPDFPVDLPDRSIMSEQSEWLATLQAQLVALADPQCPVMPPPLDTELWSCPNLIKHTVNSYPYFHVWTDFMTLNYMFEAFRLPEWMRGSHE